MLYRPEAFESLVDGHWDESHVVRAIERIVEDADSAFDVDRLWPAHEWDAWQTPVPLTCLYVGAAGVIWALDRLRVRGHAETRIDLTRAASRALELWRREPGYMAGIELPKPPEPGLLAAESGILAVAWRMGCGDELADDLHSHVVANAGNEANELMWGSPGTMLAARAMLTLSAESRWADAWRHSAEELWTRRDDDGLWTQSLYGETYRGLGPVHGLVGNVLALLQGDELLDAGRREQLARESAAVLVRTAVLDGSRANWPMAAGRGLVGEDGEIRLQWCHGAPGVVASASTYLDDELLLAGAELIWQAGPPTLEKGPSICHGTAGSGYAFLAVFERTSDELWLERARRFALHALSQVERLRAMRGRGRYSLWTGDVGAALYAADCLRARARYPLLESWD